MGYKKYKNTDHDQVITNREGIRYIMSSVDRIEHNQIEQNKRINSKISWSHFGVLLTALGLVLVAIKFAGPAVAAVMALL